MESDGVHTKFDRFVNLDKCVRERKSDIEKELSSLHKKITELQHQRKFAYKNSVKVKRKIHNEINQIVKCLRARERQLLFKVDEAYISEDASVCAELLNVQSAEARCCELNGSVEDFRERTVALRKMKDILAKISSGGKHKPLEFFSDLMSVKEIASCYGCLVGDFVEDDKIKSSIVQDILCGEYVHVPKSNDQIQQFSGLDHQKHFDLGEKTLRRERTESQDSFEIIDLLDNMRCQDSDKNSAMSELSDSDFVCAANSSPGNSNKLGSIYDCSKHIGVVPNSQFLHSAPENVKETSKAVSEVSSNITVSKNHSSEENEERIHYAQWVSNCMKKKEYVYGKLSVQASELHTWLEKTRNTVPKFDTMEIERDCESISTKINVSYSPADLIKHAFAPFLIKDNPENWLSTC